MNIALIYPEVYDIARFKEKRKEFPPFGVLYLAAVLEAEGHSVRIDRIWSGHTKLDLEDCDFVGLSVPSSATLGLVKAARETSSVRDDTAVVVGGVHANLYPEHTFEYLRPNVVTYGEGEQTILELLDFDRNRRDIDGIVFEEDGVLRKTNARRPMANISDLPLPARHLLPLNDVVMSDRLSNTDLRMAHVMFSRGCPFPCRFCAVAQTRPQYRSGDSAVRELEDLRDRYQVDGFAIVDDNFVVDRKKVSEICDAISGMNMRWSALSRVDTVRPELLEKMQRSGCIEIKYGMESGSPTILQAMKKNISPDMIRKAVRDTHSLGIKVKLFVIHGFPGENHSTTRETRSLLEELAPYVERVSLFRFVPLPGTYVYKCPEEFNLHGTNHDEDWDDDWSKFHIHHNDRHWWGDKRDFAEVCSSYAELNACVEGLWPKDAAGSRISA